MNKVLQFLGLGCVATVVAQILITGTFVARGTLNHGTFTQVVALLNGIDISGERVRAALGEAKPSELPTYGEILRERAADNIQMDLKLSAQTKNREEQESQRIAFQEEKARFDKRHKDLWDSIEKIKEGAKDDGMREVQKTLQGLEPEQAKDQLKRMYDSGRIDDVVNIIQATGLDKRTDILATFTSEEESVMLQKILQRIGEGGPVKSAIERVGQ